MISSVENMETILQPSQCFIHTLYRLVGGFMVSAAQEDIKTSKRFLSGTKTFYTFNNRLVCSCLLQTSIFDHIWIQMI